MDSKMALGLIARHGLTTLAGVLAANGYLGGSNKEQFVGAGMLLLGVGWSWYQKTGKVLVDKELARMRGVAVLALFAVALAMLVAPSAHASDLNLKSKRAFAYTPAPCLPTSCSGFFAGMNLSGTMTNANVIGNGINGSLAGGGQSIGVQAGYQFANGAWFFGPEIDANYVVAGSAVPGASPSKYRVGEYMKVGTSLATLFGMSATSATPNVPEKLAAQVISPYVIFGAVQSGIGQGWATGAGVEFALAENWFVDSRYTYINYGNAAVTPTISVPSENLVTVGFNYKF